MVLFADRQRSAGALLHFVVLREIEIMCLPVDLDFPSELRERGFRRQTQSLVKMLFRRLEFAGAA